MLNLTRAERLLLLFLAISILCGASISYLLKKADVLRKFYDCANLERSSTDLALDINKASQEELTQLQGIGESIAARIIQYREANGGFKNIEELDNINGIGPGKLESIRAHIIIK